MEICCICKKEFKSLSILQTHISIKHKNEIGLSEYYKKFINLDFINSCRYCGENTEFINLTKGYNVYCKNCVKKRISFNFRILNGDLSNDEIEAYKETHRKNTTNLHKKKKELNKNYSKENSCSCIEYWIKRGYSEEQAEIERRKKLDITWKKSIEKKNNNKNYYRKFNRLCNEYWIDKGYSEIEANEKISEIQSTFSLEKCIEKYGTEEGRQIWQDRQDKWRNTLNSKSEDEIKEINFKCGKSSGLGIHRFHKNLKLYNEFGILYYIQFFNEEIEFWKIGITKRSIKERFIKSKFHNLNYKILFKEKLNYFYAFLKEQLILKNFVEHRVPIEYNGFKSTECFNRNIFQI